MSDNRTRVVIVGGGLAGAKTAEGLRDEGFDGPIVLLAAEADVPYERPPLSKEFLVGKSGLDDTAVQTREWYAEHDVDLRLGAEAVAVRTDTGEVELADGNRVGYDRLVLATGSDPVVLGVPGGDSALRLRTRADAEAVKATFGEGKRLLVVGAGWIGLEVAAAAREAGTDVTVVESAELPLLAVLGREMGQVFADLHREHGVDLRLGAKVTEIVVEDGHAMGAVFEDGTRIEADAVVTGVGAKPNLDLAASAGVQVDKGILVDASLRTDNPAIYAVGDIAEHDHPVLGKRVRVEHWANAQNQGLHVAKALVGDEAVYDRLPYFFSDQYDLGMEYVGLAQSGEYARVVVRGDLPGREFVAFWLDAGDRVLAAMNVNVWDVQDDIKPLISGRQPVDVDKLVDTEIPLGEVSSR
ncbi:NAD(P)/FAD-dependent oxidoreductase [Jatrophihabitans fulvus]